MRLHKLLIRNFKGVVERQIDFPDDKIVVILGQNEVGKSTLVEAFSVLLTKKHTFASKQLTQIRPIGKDATPMVAAELTVSEHRVWVEKHFAGASRSKALLRYLAGPNAPKSVTGGDADNEFAELWSSSDTILWTALNEIGKPESPQLPLAGSPALSAALQAASGGISLDSSDRTLVQYALEERNLFFTKTGRPRDSYATAIAEVEQASREVEEAEVSLGQVTKTEDDLAQTKATISMLEDQLVKTQNEVNQLEVELAQIRHCQQQLSEAKLSYEKNSVRLSGALRDNQVREGLVTRVNEVCEQLAKLEQEEDSLTKKTTALGAQLDSATDSQEEANQKLLQTQNELSQTQKSLAARELEVKVQHLRELTKSVSDIRSEIADLGKHISQCLTEEVFTQAKQLNDQLNTAVAQLRASSASYSLTALGKETKLLVDGEEVDGKDGLGSELLSDTCIDIPHSWRIELFSPKISQFRQNEQTARQQLEQLLSDSGFNSFAEMNTVWHSSMAAADKQSKLVWQQDLLLAGRSWQEILDELERLETQLGESGSNNETSVDDTKLEEKLSRLSDQLAERKENFSLATAKSVQLQSALNVLAQEKANLAGQIDQVKTRQAKAVAELEQAREVAADDELAKQLADIQEECLKDEQALARQQKIFEDLDAAEKLTRSQEAETVLKTCQERLAREEKRANELTGALQGMAADERQTRSDLAKTKLQHAQSALERIEARAKAALLLYDTLSANLAAQEAKYRKPFVSTITRLGSQVYQDDSFSVSLDENLIVTHRVKDCVEVPFDQLSTGAKEQLLILVKLAAAILVDPNEGMPIFLDDLLGHTDGRRYKRMNRALELASTKAQLIVLTSDEQNYSGLANKVEIIFD